MDSRIGIPPSHTNAPITCARVNAVGARIGEHTRRALYYVRMYGYVRVDKHVHVPSGIRIQYVIRHLRALLVLRTPQRRRARIRIMLLLLMTVTVTVAVTVTVTVTVTVIVLVPAHACACTPIRAHPRASLMLMHTPT